MKKIQKIISVILLCGVLLSGCGKTQPEPETTQPESGTEVVEQTTEGTVAESQTRTVEVDYGEGIAYFEFNEKGLLVSEKNRPWGDVNIVYSYDEENRITETVHTLRYQEIYKEYKRVAYVYDSEGTLIRSDVYTLPEDELDEYYEYKYENGKLVEKAAYDNVRGTIIYSHSNEYHYKETESGTEITFKEVFDGETTGESISTYDKNGRLILEDYSQGAGLTEYVYDENGKLIKEIYGYDEKELAYEYENDNDKPSKAVWVKDELASGEQNLKGKYRVYKYYDNGNIAADYRYDASGNIEDIIIEAVPEVKGNYAEIDEFWKFSKL